MTNSTLDLAQADCIFLIGSNPTEQHPLVARRIILAKEGGAKLIVADPRKIQLANLADTYLRHRIGTDVALLNGMMNIIIENELHDKSFIEARTEGFEEFFTTIKDYPLARAAEITQVPAEDIKQAALTYAKAGSSAIVYAMGITQHTTGTDNVLSIANLAMLTGNIGKPGTGVDPLRGQNNVQGACDAGCLVNVLPGYQKVTDQEKRLKVAQVWQVPELPAEVGLTLVEMMNAAAEGKVKAMYIIGENPMISDPDTNHVRQALENLDFLVVQDIFPPEVTQLADIVLPAACWAEKEGTFTATDRRVQMVRKAIDPPGEAKSDWKIICELARGMGAGNLFSFGSANEIFEELRKVCPLYAGMTYERLNQPDGLQWPCPAEDHPGTPFLHKQQFTRGLGKLHPVSYRAPAEEPDEEYPFILTTGRMAFHWHTRSMTGRSPALDNEAPEGYVEISPEDAQRLGIMDGHLVEVSTRRGRIKTKTLIDERVSPGVIFIPFHFAERAANVLTHQALDPVAKIPEYKICAARVEKSC